MDKDKHYFIVTSHGWSGSFWLAHSLHTHPDVTCAHSAENLLASDPILHNKERHIKTVRSLAHAMQARQHRPIDSFFDEIEKFEKSVCYGSVHVFRLRDLPIQKERFGSSARDYKLMNLVRHPVSFIWSGFGQLREMFEYDVFVLKGTMQLVLGKAENFVFELAKNFNLNLCDREVMSFLGACANLYNLANDIRAASQMNYVEHIQMEQVTSNVDVYKSTFENLTSGKLSINNAYLQEVFASGQLNKHKKDSANKKPEQRYAQLEPWQERAVKHFLKETELQSSYERIGYDFSFIR